MKNLLRKSVLWPKSILAILLIITALAAVTLVVPGLGMDPNPYPLNKDHPSMVAYRQLKDDFTGTLETALVLLRHPATVYNPATLERIALLTEALENISLIGPGDVRTLSGFLPGLQGEPRALVDSVVADGITHDDDIALAELEDLLEVDVAAYPALIVALEEIRLKMYPVKKVTSLSNVENIVSLGDDLIVGKVYEKIPRTGEEVDRVASQVRGNDLFHKLLISTDERSTGILVETNIPDDRSELMFALAEKMELLVEEILGEEELHIAGMPVLAATAVNTMQKDNAVLFPIVVGLVAMVLLLTFRSLRGVLLPMAVVIISLIWTLAVMSLLGIPLNMMTTALPVFLITVGVADGIHLVSEFKDQFRRLASRREAVFATLRHMAMPVFMTSITTAAGFVVLGYTDVKPIREFGLFVAVGVMMAMVVSLVLIPAALALGGNRPRSLFAFRGWNPFQGFDSFALGILVRLSRFAVNRRRLVLSLGLVLVAMGLYGMTRIQVENDFITYFDKNSPIVKATELLDRDLAGSNVANLLISMKEGPSEPFKDPAILAKVEDLQRHLDNLPYVGKTVSLTDILKRINLVLHANDAAFHRLPKTVEWVNAGGSEAGTDGDQAAREKVSGRDLVAQYLLLYENGGGENLSDYTDSKFSTLNMRVSLATRSTSAIQQLQEAIDRYVALNFPPKLQVRFAGNAELLAATNNEILKSQIFSLSVSFVVILLLLMIQYRSPVKAFLAMIPLTVAVIVNFGVMGFFGIHLNIGTAVISSIVIGIGVDFAIHYLSRLMSELERQDNLLDAIQATMESSGKAITSNAFTVAIGFLALLMSGFLPMKNMGWMIAQLLLVSGLATLVLLPAAVAFFNPAFVRDALSRPRKQDLAA